MQTLKIDPHHKPLKSIGIGLFLIVSVIIGLIGMRSYVEAAPGGLNFQLLTTHPYASKAGYNSESTNYYTGQKLCPDQSFCPTGQSLVDMEIDQNGKIVAGYGDYDSNVDSFGVHEGRVGVVPYDIQSNSWGAMTYAGSEALQNIRKFDGKLYTTTTDPSDKLASGQSQSSVSGYLTDASGSWQFMNDGMGSIHVYDIQKVSDSEYWLFGSVASPFPAAVAWRSIDGGVTWAVAKQDQSAGVPTYFERYYWGAVLNGKVYMQAPSTNPQVPMRVYDLAEDVWRDAPTDVRCDTAYAKQVVVFDDKIICISGSTLKVFDDTGTTNRALPDSGSAIDFYVDSEKLYILSSLGNIYWLNGIDESFEYLGTMDDIGGQTPHSIAVYEDYMYVGGDGGKIWRSTTTITNAPLARPEVTSVNPTSIQIDNASRTVTIQGADFGANPSVTLGGKPVPVVQSTKSSITVSIDTRKFTIGKATLEVTHANGEVGSLSDAIEFTNESVARTPTITNVSFHAGVEEGTTRLHVTGLGLLQPLSGEGKGNHYWSIGLRTRLVALNGAALPACMNREAYATLKNYYERSTMSVDAPCYQLIDYDIARNKINTQMSDSAFDIIISKSNSAARHGAVKLVGGSFGSAILAESNNYNY